MADELERIASGRSLWPNYDPLSIPLAIFDGSNTYLFRHPKPPEGFEKSGRAAIYSGRHPAVTANTSVEIGGVPTATLLLDELRPGGSLTQLAATGLHEAFHVFQAINHPSWGGNEVDLFTYPFDNPEVLAKRRLETEALRRAFEAQDPEAMACWTKVALHTRRERFQQMDSAHVAYERGIELGEGLAFYVEKKALQSNRPDIPQTGFPADGVRQRGYTTGVALALLLQRVAPDWEEPFEKDDQTFLDVLLEQHLRSSASSACAFESTEVEQARVQARSDVAALLTQRKQLRSEFEARLGWQLVIDSAEGKPLWPQRFDPLNLHLVDSGVFHTRFLKLGNAAGELELLGSPALTESAGSHPLFNGIKRFVMTGIADKPGLAEEGGEVSIEIPTFKATFSPARVTESQQAVHIKLLTQN